MLSKIPSLKTLTCEVLIESLPEECLEKLASLYREKDGTKFLKSLGDEEDFSKVWQTYEECIAYVLDMKVDLVKQVSNRDIIAIPELVHKEKINYFQAISSCNYCRDVIDTVFIYVFHTKDCYLGYNEPFDFNQKELELRREFHEHIKEKYKTAEVYMASVENKLWENNCIDQHTKKLLKKAFET
jgi:hypothetical protein